jgi:hypothetical protein
MARYKVLKGVAHNTGHSFTSLMNYAGDDYVMGHVLRLARQTGRDTLTIDLVNGHAGPLELLAAPISEVPSRYMKMFWYLVERHGSDRSLVQNAMLTLRYDTAVERPIRIAPELTESPFTCDVRITDVRGVEYQAHFEGWWYPERLNIPQIKSSLQLKLWNWFRTFVPRRPNSRIAR